MSRGWVARPDLHSRIKELRVRNTVFVSQKKGDVQEKNFASWLLIFMGCSAIKEVAGNARRIQISVSVPVMNKLRRIAKDRRDIADTSAGVPTSGTPEEASAKTRKASTGHVVSCRLGAEEQAAFDGLCLELGASSRSEGLRLVVRMASGFLEFSRIDAGHLDGMRHDLHRISTGVNQIALLASRGRSDLVREQWAVVDELRRLLPGLRILLGRIVAERRRQGVTLFRDFVAGEENSNG